MSYSVRVFSSCLIITALLAYSTGAFASVNLDAVEMLKSISLQLHPWERLIRVASYILGILLFFKAMYYLRIYGESRIMGGRDASLKIPLVNMTIGAALIYFPTALEIAMQSTFGYESILMYSDWRGSPTSGTSRLVMVSVFNVVKFIGLVSFVRGMMMLTKAAQQGAQVSTAKGFTHVIAGILGMNIVGTANLMSATLGIHFS